MLVCFLKMLLILVLCPVLLGGVQTLTIDSQLGTSVEDCFERLSIGEQLPGTAIYRNVSELTTRECEQICKQDKQCQSYDYGVGAKGNATCNLSTLHEKEVKEKNPLTRHPDYDVYVRRFQCEQSPPSPMQTLLDEPAQDKPQHRPVFRPDMDELPDYLVSSDIDPYNNGKPSYRPDDVSQRPNLDIGPSYGDHKPQNIPYLEDPYRPEKPSHPEILQDYKPTKDPYKPNRFEKPQDPYMPSRPYKKPKPESNDVLHFDVYGNPVDEFHKDPYMPDKLNYNYIIRPNRRPRPEDEFINPTKPIDHYSGHPSGPIGPPRPTYSYNSQYAGNYGQNSQNDNHVQVVIYDPPRPYIPIKDRPSQPDYGQGFLGYGTYSSQNSYTQNSGYTGSITEIGHDHMPYKPEKPYGQDEPGYHKPSKPNKGSYGIQNDYIQNSNSYGNKPPINDHYGFQRPNDRYKPLGNQNSHNQNSYGSHDQSQFNYGDSYNSPRPTYQTDSGYQKPQKPSYIKPSYGGDKGDNGIKFSYGGNQVSYGGNQESFGGNQGYYSSNKGESNTQSSYNNGQSSYNTQGSYGQGSYSQDSYGFQGDYGTQGYANDNYFGGQGGYGISQATYGSSTSYGGNKGSYSSNHAGYGANQGSYGSNQASYGSNHGSYGSYNSGYGGYSSPRPMVVHGNRPVYDYETHKPGYDNDRPDYNKKPGYGSQKPDYDSPRPGYDHKPAYHKPAYESERPDPYEPTSGYGRPETGYGNEKPNYGDEKPIYDDDKVYGNERPHYDTQRPGYSTKPDGGNQNPGYGNQKPGDTVYGSNATHRPDVKPVYEYETDKPSHVPAYIARPGGEVVTSRPVLIGDYQRPGYKHPGDYQRPGYKHPGDYQRPGYKHPSDSYAGGFPKLTRLM